MTMDAEYVAAALTQTNEVVISAQDFMEIVREDLFNEEEHNAYLALKSSIVLLSALAKSPRK